jgi:hypothetical protein
MTTLVCGEGSQERLQVNNRNEEGPKEDVIDTHGEAIARSSKSSTVNNASSLSLSLFFGLRRAEVARAGAQVLPVIAKPLLSSERIAQIWIELPSKSFSSAE